MYIDLTHLINSQMPVYPGTEPPKIYNRNSIKTDGFEELEISMYSHTGTHIDAPAHMILNGKTLDEYPISHFVGKAFLLDVSNKIPSLETLKQKETTIKTCDFIVIKTNWSKYWGSEKYFYNFPVVPKEHIEWLLSFKLKGFAIDAISIDPIETSNFQNHLLILNKGLTITENLKQLDLISNEVFELIMLPLKIEKSDGFSARVMAKI